jgi:hypothetical protein
LPYHDATPVFDFDATLLVVFLYFVVVASGGVGNGDVSTLNGMMFCGIVAKFGFVVFVQLTKTAIDKIGINFFIKCSVVGFQYAKSKNNFAYEEL